MRRLARRGTGADLDALYLAIAAIEGELQPPRALGVRLQHVGQFAQQAVRRRGDGLAAGNRLGEILPHPVGHDGSARR